jgi:RNA polymerase sigma-70 factor (ECF subfamily)
MARASTTSLIMVEPAADSREVWFGQQIELLLPDLYGAALRLARDEMDAEDVVGEAIASAWTHLATLERRATFRGWMFRILTNCFYSRRRADKARGAEERFDEEPDEETGFSLFERLHQPVLLWWGNPERDFLNKLLREDLEAAVDGLPEAFRVVVVLADLEGLSYQEIAAALEIPIGTVRSRLARGRSLLQRALWTYAVDAGLRQPDATQKKDSDDE